jgi:hypothetical protein
LDWVITGVDPRKLSVTIEARDNREILRATGRFPPRSPDPPHLAVLARPGFVRAAPALPATTRIGLPSATATCCDRPQAKASHLHTNQQRLTAQTKLGPDPPKATQPDRPRPAHPR